MRIIVKRPFNLSTMLWRYKLEINGQTFAIKDRRETVIDIPDCSTMNIRVNFNSYFTSYKQFRDAALCKEITISSRINNLSAIGALFVMVALLIHSIYIDNNLYLFIGFVIYSLLQIIYYDLLKARFFKIECK